MCNLLKVYEIMDILADIFVYICRYAEYEIVHSR